VENITLALMGGALLICPEIEGREYRISLPG